MILVNKWDHVEKDSSTAHKYEQELRNKIAPFQDVPILFTSVKEKKRIVKALEEAMAVHEERRKWIPTHELNERMLSLIEANPPPMDGKKKVRIKYIHQIPGRTPSFVFHCDPAKGIKAPYKRFLENKLRKFYGFRGVPIRLFFRQK